MNKRNTVQKTLVLEVVQSLKNHTTADEIYDEIIKSSDKLPVYFKYKE